MFGVAFAVQGDETVSVKHRTLQYRSVERYTVLGDVYGRADVAYISFSRCVVTVISRSAFVCSFVHLYVCLHAVVFRPTHLGVRLVLFVVSIGHIPFAVPFVIFA